MVIEDAALLNRRVTHMTPAALFSRRLQVSFMPERTLNRATWPSSINLLWFLIGFSMKRSSRTDSPAGALKNAMDSFRCLEVHDFVQLVKVMHLDPDDGECSAADVIRLIEAIGPRSASSSRLSSPLLWGAFKVTGRLD